jgi:endonuclease G
MRSESTGPSPILIVVIALCIVLVVAGFLLSRSSSHTGSSDWAWGPVKPGQYSATQAGTPVAPYAVRPYAGPAGGFSAQMLLGNPSNAAPDASNPDNYLMPKPYFALAYNNSAGEPRWVSWRLCVSDLGSAPRKETFDPDETLPAGFNVVTMRDYDGSGFDRGHMCDHSDRAATLESSYATFVMTNMVPQAPNNNRKCWAQLEDYCRQLARSGDRLYITAGPEGQGGVGSRGSARTLGEHNVVVPASTWKVIVVTPDTGSDDLANVNASDRVIAVDVPNDNDRLGEEWAGFRCSPASIESKTGLHFFTALPASVRTTFEDEVDRESTPPPRDLEHDHYR